MMKFNRRIGFSVALILSAAAPRGGGQQPADKKPQARAADVSPAEGKKTFESICASCHALDARGGERGPNIASRPDVLRMSDAELLAVIANGKPAAGMPPFAYLGPAKVKAVLQHLRALQGKEKITRLPGDATRGANLFSGKGGCAACHLVNGAGGFLGSDLTAYAANLPMADIRQAIVEPSKNLAPRKGTVVVTTRDARKFTGIARNEDNFSLQLQTPDGAFHFFQKSELENLEYQPISIMPADYGTKLSSAELDDLISYLVTVARAKHAAHPKTDQEWEDE
ncbi:MAG TPA: c-type cytochrome [Candidatus Saccharimonadales bacterium]|nr:c-type cytochrome [Candidatus Saccharimonadales bacterium]